MIISDFFRKKIKALLWFSDDGNDVVLRVIGCVVIQKRNLNFVGILFLFG